MGIGSCVDVSVGAVTDTGPRSVNADRFVVSRSPVDGSWVIAVADGVGGHPEAPDAAQAAVEGLPERIGSLDAMGDAFIAASERVAALAPSRDDFWAAERAECGDTVFELMMRSGASVYRYLARCPLCTMCVAAWTPAGGLLVAAMGDMLAFEVQWPAAGTPWRRLIAEPHREPPFAHGVSSYLGADHDESVIRPQKGDYHYHDGYNRNFAAVQMELPADPATSMAVIIASDGAWEPLRQIIHAADDAATAPGSLLCFPLTGPAPPSTPARSRCRRCMTTTAAWTTATWPTPSRRSPAPPRRRLRSRAACSTRPVCSASTTTPPSPPR